MTSAAPGLPKPIRWAGGKGTMLAKLLPLVPYGPDVRVYVEPYCGGASLFFAKRPHPVEVLNDRDERLITLFRTLQDEEGFRQLRHRLLHTPYARSEFVRAIRILQEGGSAVDIAWALFVAANQAFGAKLMGIGARDWGRAFVSTGGVAATVNRWLMCLSHLDAWHRRLLMAQIDCRDALEVIAYWDSTETFFYLDPPYVPETRRTRRLYVVEAELDHHERLVEALLALQGMALLSAYAHPVYEPLVEAGWERRDWHTASHMAGRIRRSRLRGPGSALAHVPCVESVYISPRLAARLRSPDWLHAGEAVQS